MKKFACPICNQSDLVKENDLFVCQGCGTKYSVEEVKRVLFETENTYEAPVIPVTALTSQSNEERVLARSVSSTKSIAEWKKKYIQSRFICALLPLIIPIVTIINPVLLFGYSFEAVSEYIYEELSGFEAVGFWGCILLSVILLFWAISSISKADEEANPAQITAKKENITVTNLKIYGSTETGEFSVPCSKIKNTYIERLSGVSSVKFTQEVLCIVCENKVLRFEFFENNSEISNAIKTVIPKDAVSEAVYSIKILDYAYYRSAMKAVIKITQMDLHHAQKFLKLDNLPQIIAENISKDKAEEYARILEEFEVKFEIFQS